MKVIFLGPPGAGKGTQAEKLTAAMDMVHLSTGDILRKNIKEETFLGKEAKGFIAEGKLVPDQLIMELVRDYLVELGEKNVLFDGFPRTLVQANQLDEMLKDLNTGIDKVINLQADSEKIIQRITGRRVCGNCNAPYHMAFNPPKNNGTCDICGHGLVHRPDDTDEVVRKRIEVYQEQTMPLVEYYKGQGKIANVNGDQKIDEVFGDIKHILGK